MKKPLLIILFLLSAIVAKAQKNDTTTYYGCKIKGDTNTYVGKQTTLRMEELNCAFFAWPKFPGGEKAYNKFLIKNFNWPKGSQKGKGRVFISMVIEKNGSLSHITIIHSISSSVDAEALRVIKLSPRWIPAKYYGKTIRCRYIIFFPKKSQAH